MLRKLLVTAKTTVCVQGLLQQCHMHSSSHLVLERSLQYLDGPFCTPRLRDASNRRTLFYWLIFFAVVYGLVGVAKRVASCHRRRVGACESCGDLFYIFPLCSE